MKNDVYHQQEKKRIERQHLQAFRAFYEALPDKQHIFYMFFTSGTLHWLRKSLQLIPVHVNIVIIGADLAPEEQQWLKTHCNRPVHVIPTYVDDNTIWEFLFKVNHYNFGWIDIDCFVLNPDLFTDMIQIKDNDAINCVWAYSHLNSIGMEHYHPNDFHFLNTYFLYINLAVYKKICSLGIRISPSVYTERPSITGRGSAAKQSNASLISRTNVLSARHKRIIKKALPCDKDGNPIYFRSGSENLVFFDTLRLYQLIFMVQGYRLNRVRMLSTYSSTPCYFSNEAVHVGQITWYKTYPSVLNDPDYQDFSNNHFHMNTDYAVFGSTRNLYLFILIMDYLTLSQGMVDLPKMYNVLLRSIKANIKKQGMDEQGARQWLTQFLGKQGITERNLKLLLGE